MLGEATENWRFFPRRGGYVKGLVLPRLPCPQQLVHCSWRSLLHPSCYTSLLDYEGTVTWQVTPLGGRALSELQGVGEDSVK